MQLIVLHSQWLSLAQYEDGDPADLTSFMGVFTELKRARRFAQQVVDKSREAANQELEEGEAPYPEMRLAWTKHTEPQPGDKTGRLRRERWESDRVELDGEAYYFEAVLTTVDPVLT